MYSDYIKILKEAQEVLGWSVSGKYLPCDSSYVDLNTILVLYDEQKKQSENLKAILIKRLCRAFGCSKTNIRMILTADELIIRRYKSSYGEKYYKMVFKLDEKGHVQLTTNEAKNERINIKSLLDIAKDAFSFRYTMAVISDNETTLRTINPNSNIMVSINDAGVSAYISAISRNEFEIRHSYKRGIEMCANSLTVLPVLNDNLDKLLYQILIDVSDCPEWLQNLLAVRRAKIKEEYKRKNAKEAAKEKRRERIKSFFLWQKEDK